MLVAAGEVLADLPVTARLFAEGSLSWGRVRGIVGVEELRDRRSQERSQRRRATASFLALQAGLDGGVRLYGELDPLLGAGVLNALDATAGRPDGDARQGPHPPPREPGGPDPGLADANADADGHPGHTGAGGGEPEGDPAEATSRARQYAKAWGRICADWLGGDIPWLTPTSTT